MTAEPTRNTTRHLLAPDPGTMRAIGACLGAAAEPGDVIALRGPLGAGKTELARGIARGLGIPGPISSPTFIVIAEHEGRLPLFHIDAYRLEGAEDALAAGILDERRADGVTVIEWAERLGPALPAGRLEIRIDGAGDEPRTLDLVATDEPHAVLLDVLDAMADPSSTGGTSGTTAGGPGDPPGGGR